MTVPRVDGRTRRDGRLRPDIQALRAVAALAVVGYHLFPGRLPGGYVGVDIFFAVSGFLILGQLLRTVRAGERPRVVDFWVRRARRLLPAALLVLAVTAIGVLVWAPRTLWPSFFPEIGASAAYVENFLLAHDSVNYLAAEGAPSPVQHYWSLSVEEQLYLIAPLVLLLLVAVTGGRRVERTRLRWRLSGALLVAVTLASFGYAAALVAAQTPTAYFSTFGRVWEFAAGGLLAFFLAGRPAERWPALRSAVSWAGWALIAGAILLYRADTPFPGPMAAVPVLGAVAVIWAGAPSSRWSPRRLMQFTPVQWVGDISYSVYLWHWPLLIVLPFAIGTLGTRDKVAILAATIVLAALTRRYVETPLRLRPGIRVPALRSLAVVVVPCVIVAGATFGLGAYSSHQAATTAAAQGRAAASGARCVGLNAVLPGHDCARPYAVTGLTDPAAAESDIPLGVNDPDPCKQELETAAVMSCTKGDTRSPTTVIALVGDSHAGQLIEPMDAYGTAHHVEVVTYIKSWCAGTGSAAVAATARDIPAAVSSCASWGKSVAQAIAGNPRISAVVFTDYAMAYGAADAADAAAAKDGSAGEPVAGALAQQWRALQAAGKTIVAVRDIPSAGGVDVPSCVAQHLDQYDPCTVPESAAALGVDRDPIALAAHAVAGVRLIDLTALFCTAGVCHNVIGGLVVHKDDNHLTGAFATSLATALGERLTPIVAP
ncbi:MAG TPA: acyltransferase family protein [Gryllotalpicola sp.]